MKFKVPILKSACAIPLFIILLGIPLAVFVFIANRIFEVEFEITELEMLGGTIVWVIISVVFSSIPIVMFGWPACIVAERLNILRKCPLLFISSTIGGTFLGCVFYFLYGESGNWAVFTGAFMSGSVAGLFVGSVCWRYINLTRQ